MLVVATMNHERQGRIPGDPLNNSLPDQNSDTWRSANASASSPSAGIFGATSHANIGPTEQGGDSVEGNFGSIAQQFPSVAVAPLDSSAFALDNAPPMASSFFQESASSGRLPFPVPSRLHQDIADTGSAKDFLLNSSNTPSLPLKEQTCEVDTSLPFPAKLHYILSHPKYQEYISWCRHGRAWKVIKPREFEKEVIPKFFRSNKFASFMRQVNGWAFVRVTEGADLNAYYHELFLRGFPILCLKMRRPPKVKNAAYAARAATGAGFGIPDFDRISNIAPLPPSLPFQIQIKEGDKAEGSSTGPSANREYVIKPLNVESQSEGNEMEMEHISVKSLLLHNDGLPDSSTIPDPFDGQREKKINTQTSESDRKQPPSAAMFQQLSKADIRYLAHQNKMLLADFQGEQNV